MAKTKSSTKGLQQKKIVVVSGYKKSDGTKSKTTPQINTKLNETIIMPGRLFVLAFLFLKSFHTP